ncbi:MAG: hypothetical protein DRH57_07350 [Candidatus Cloacimonadota bacterium]|nr:MAG: hypothetical protein DRH57_07350 [Candidatus Cloacimonadota bacterium]
MTIFIKNLTDKQIKIHSLKLGLQANETRKLVASFDKEYTDAKNELDILVDDKQLEIIDSLGQNLTTSEVFTNSVDNNQQKIKDTSIQSSELKEERFYYVEDVFCVSKDARITKSFKGYADTFKIAVKQKSIKYRIKSKGIVMPWQYLKQDKENILNFEYRLCDPEIEILSDEADVSVNIYIDGYVTNVSPIILQNFIDTWYENQSACNNTEWYGEAGWWDDNKISEEGEWASWNWASKIGSFTSKTINDYALNIGTKIIQQNEGAKLIIPSTYKSLDGIDSSDFKVFRNEQGTYTIELVGYNDWASWDLNTFKVEIENIRYLEFEDQTFDVTTMELGEWNDRWTDSQYYGSTGLKFVSENAGFKSAIGSYTVGLNGKPKVIKLIIDDQNQLEPGAPLTALSEGEYDFFIIANGADAVTMDSVITFDIEGDYPLLKVDDVLVDYPVYFSDPELNYDGKDHFIYEDDNNGGTNILIEDLPGLGDEDFDDVILNVNFPMTDKISIHTPETIEEALSCELSETNIIGITTNAHGIGTYAMGRIGDGGHQAEHTDCQLWRFRNGTDSELKIKVFHHTSKKTEYYTIPANTDMYKLTPYEHELKMYWEEVKNSKVRVKYSKKKHTHNMFNNNINLKNESIQTIVEINEASYKS